MASNGYLEDATTSLITATPDIATANQQASAAANDSNAISSANSNVGTPTVESSPAPANANQAAASNPQFNSQESPTVNVGGAGTNVQTPTNVENINPLLNYANYTYKFSLYAVNKDAINQIAQGAIQPGSEESIIAGGALLLSSGGSNHKSAYFRNDFYIDNVNFTSVVGLSARNRSTDIVEISFDIIEPYNVTFLPNLILTAQSLTGYQDWSLCFYILKIEFIGYNDAGLSSTIPNTTKYIPFSMVDMQFDVSVKGTVYKIKGVPCHHSAQTPLDNTIPFHMEIQGGTIDEIFNGPIKSSDVANSLKSESAGSSGTTPTNTTPATNTYTRGVAQALNDGEQYIKSTKAQEQANQYAFVFLDDIGSKSLVDNTTFRDQAIRMSNPKNTNETIPNTIKLDTTKNTVRVQAGTRITDLINTILQLSKFYTDQYNLSDPSPNTPLFFHKVTPVVEYGPFDNCTNMWSRKITYFVKAYPVYGNDKENLGQQAPQAPVKRYKWIFTGQNRDVLDVNLHYQMAFFDLRNAGTLGMIKNAQGTSSDTNTTLPDCKIVPGPFTKKVRPVLGIADQNNTGAKDANLATLTLEELFKKQFDSAGDLVKLKLSIVGDPDLIQQDGILYGASSTGGQIKFSNGSVNYASGELYFYFDFVSPMNDYDDQTGLFDISASQTNYISGYYRIVSVKSEFRNGKFTQTMENFRVRKQSNTNTNNQRTTAATINNPAAEAATQGTTNTAVADSNNFNYTFGA